MPRGHCIDYWHKWKKEGNFCGLRKQDADMNDTYLSIVEKISGNGAGLDSDFVFDHFTAGAARPLIRCKDEEARIKAMNYVIACLKRGEDVTGGDLQATIEGFMGKPAKSTQMRKSEPVKEPCPGGETCPDCPAPCSVVDKCNPILSLAAQQAEKEQHVHPGAICTVNPIVINDTLREVPPIITDTTGKVSPVRDIPPNSRELKPSPFKTAAQVMAHDKDPLDVAGMFKDMDKAETVVKDTLTPQDPAKVLKEKRIQLAEDLLSCYSERFQMAARDYIRKETSWKNGAADFFYFGGEMLMDPPKVKASSAGAVMRRS